MPQINVKKVVLQKKSQQSKLKSLLQLKFAPPSQFDFQFLAVVLS